MSELDLKYRPSNFSEVIGNSGVVKLLLTRSRNGSLDHQSMMLSGPKGCGKTTLARIIAKALSCGNLQDGEPCGECASCLSITNETSQDYEEMDAASHGTVEKIRGMIKDADYESFNGGRQIYIVDEAQRLSAAAQDAFLKAVESRLFIVILCTTDPQKVKAPIRSRLEEYPIHPPPTNELINRLKSVCSQENIKFTEEGIQLIVKIKENCPRECLIALDTISQIGSIDDISVKSHFRFKSFELISQMLQTIDSSPSEAFVILDELFNQESPTWIKDHIIMAISSSLRVSIGAKPTFPVPTNFFANRGRSWVEIVGELNRVDRINMSDIESILLKNSKHIPIVDIIPPIVKKEITVEVLPSKQDLPKIEEKSEEKKPDTAVVNAVPSSKKRKEVTIDGVNYSSDEKLTSLDKKIERKSETDSGDKKSVFQVELSLEHAPLTEKDFADNLVSRFKS